MKYNTPSLTSLVRKSSLIGLISISALSLVQAAPPPSSFGVWDRGDTFDAKEYPFLKGMSFNDSWDNIEKQSGVFDWSGLDQAIEKAFRNKTYLYLSLGVGPGSPNWIYEQGVPKVFTDDTRHLNKWKCYPYYLSPAYKKFQERLITEFGKHIRSYPLEKQERIAFIQVKTGCTGDECAYKGNAKEARYELEKSSPEWREFRLWAFYFFNRYAGQIYPETATGAFCALHKGLDAADTKAYAEEKFGKATPKNVDRMLKICEAFSKHGASADDKEALTMGQVEQRRSQKGFNDVGWDIWPDNYGRFLYQIDADETSIPLWRIGGPITKASSIYSRFARGFEHATEKDAMYFNLHEGFSQDAKPKVMSVHVVWYDNQKGSAWKLVYDAGEPAMKTALTVTGKGDQQWHDETVTLKDAVLFHGGTKGSDLALVNTDDHDDIFSLIEVHRGKGNGVKSILFTYRCWIGRLCL